MFHNVLIAAFVSAACLISATATAGSVTELSKDEWLGKLKEVVPAMMCNGFRQNASINEQLVAAKIDYRQCIALMPASFETCRAKFYSDIPHTVNKAIANQWGENLGECIGTDFARNHFLNQ